MTYYFLRWIVLIFLGLLIYGQTFQYGFVFDDQYFIVNNPYIRSFSQVHLMWQVFPVTRLIGMYSFALNYYFNQIHPQGYHIFNFIVHLTATGLVWALAGLLVRRELAFFIAVIFLVHPCQTQAVTYITQRFESMATVFYLSTVYFYLRARLSSDKTHKVILFGLAGISIISGILTKEVIVTVPVMILAAEWILFPQKNKKGLYTALVIVGIMLCVTLNKMLHSGFGALLHASLPSESHDGDILTTPSYLMTQLRVFLTFLRLLIWPIHQNLDYDYPASSGLLNPPLTLVGLSVILGFIALIIKLRRKYPSIAFGLAWVLITFSINLAPRSNVIFEHKLYLISFGFFLAFVSTLDIWVKNRKILLMILWCLIACFAVLSFHRNKIWKNEFILWNETLQESPLKARPLNNQGLAYFHLGNFTQAMADYNKAIEINPNYSSAYNNRGLLYFKQGNWALAISNLNLSIEKNTEPASTYSSYSNRGLAYFHLGNFTRAMADYNKAIELNPYFADAYSNRGLLYYNQSNFAQAVSDYTKAIELNPNVSDDYNNRGTCYVNLGMLMNALADYNKAVENDPHNIEAVKNRAMLQNVILSAAKNHKVS